MKNSYAFHVDKLQNEYLTTFQQIEMYVNAQYIDDATQEELLSELLDIFLTSQEADKPVKSIVGNNLEEFCKAFCSDCGIKNKILHILDGLKSISWALVFISGLDILTILFDYLDGVSVDFFATLSSINVSGYLMGIVVAMIIGFTCNFVVRNLMFKTKHVSMNLLKIITYVISGFAVAGIFIIIYSNETSLFNFPVWVVLLIGLIYLAIYYPFNYKRIHVKAEHKIHFGDIVNADMEKEFTITMEKSYAKANQRSIKKGKGELSMADFLDEQEKDCKNNEKSKLFNYIFPIVITPIVMIFEYFNGGFESYIDAIIFPVIMLTVEYAVMIGMWKLTKSGVDQRRKWIKAKRKELALCNNHSDLTIDLSTLDNQAIDTENYDEEYTEDYDEE